MTKIVVQDPDALRLYRLSNPIHSDVAWTFRANDEVYYEPQNQVQYDLVLDWVQKSGILHWVEDPFPVPLP